MLRIQISLFLQTPILKGLSRFCVVTEAELCIQKETGFVPVRCPHSNNISKSTQAVTLLESCAAASYNLQNAQKNNPNRMKVR